jgi:hypothetical protein
VSSQNEIDREWQRIDEIRRMRDEHPMISVRSLTQELVEPGAVAHASAPAREPGNGHGVASGKRHEGALVDEASNTGPGKHVSAGKAGIAFGCEHAKRGIEMEPSHERAQVVLGLLFGRSPHLVLHVIPGQHDQIRGVLHAGSQGALLVRPHSGRLDVRDVKDSNGPDFRAIFGAIDAVRPHPQKVRFHMVCVNVDCEDQERDDT